MNDVNETSASVLESVMTNVQAVVNALQTEYGAVFEGVSDMKYPTKLLINLNPRFSSIPCDPIRGSVDDLIAGFTGTLSAERRSASGYMDRADRAESGWTNYVTT